MSPLAEPNFSRANHIVKVYSKATMSVQPCDAWLGVGVLLVLLSSLLALFLFQSRDPVEPIFWWLLAAGAVVGVLMLLLGYRLRFPDGIPYVMNIKPDFIEVAHDLVSTEEGNELDDATSSPHRRRFMWADLKEVAVAGLSSDPVLILELVDGTFVAINLGDVSNDPAIIAEMAIHFFRQSRGKPALHVELAARNITIPCPVCEIATDSLKSYTLGTMVFAFVVIFTQAKTMTCCPTCMRGKISDFLFGNVITSNVIWPFVIAPYSVILLISTYTRGHSKEVLKTLALHVAPESWTGNRNQRS
ncbi:MAG: hypothetical protein JWP89_3989 [Schlesneria sp.]|nr:hypothetical protein [Schlesneria sp.]